MRQKLQSSRILTRGGGESKQLIIILKLFKNIQIRGDEGRGKLFKNIFHKSIKVFKLKISSVTVRLDQQQISLKFKLISNN